MATEAISGSFKASPRYQGYDEKDPTDNWGAPVDMRHNDPSFMAYGGRFPEAAIPSESVPPALEDMFNPGAEPPYYPDPDREPRTHDTPNVPSAGIKEPRASAVASAARERGYGEENIYKRSDKVARDATETHESPRVQSLPPGNDQTAPGQAQRAMRGKNSLPLNNEGSPEQNYSGNYTRQGFELFRWTNRTMPRRKLTHTKRPLYLNVAQVATETPGATGSGWTPYASDVTSVSTQRVGPKTPAIRQEPPPWDENAVMNGEEEDFANTSDYLVFGL